MIGTKTKQVPFATEFNRLEDALKTKVQNASVKLVTPAFKASGVIFTKDDNYAYVLTALHSVYVLDRKMNAPAWDDAMVTRFQKAVSIEYGAHVFGNVKDDASVHCSLLETKRRY